MKDLRDVIVFWQLSTVWLLEEAQMLHYFHHRQYDVAFSSSSVVKKRIYVYESCLVGYVFDQTYFLRETDVEIKPSFTVPTEEIECDWSVCLKKSCRPAGI